MVLVRGAKISEYGGGKSITVIGGTVIRCDPVLHEGDVLRRWFDNGGGLDSNTISGGIYDKPVNWLTLREARIKDLDEDEKSFSYRSVCVVKTIRDTNLTYESCTQVGCKKKVVQISDDLYRCESCNVEMDKFNHQMILEVCVFI